MIIAHQMTMVLYMSSCNDVVYIINIYNQFQIQVLQTNIAYEQINDIFIPVIVNILKLLFH